MYRGPILFPLVLIVLGFLLLFSNLGYIQFDFWQFVTTWWPLLLIIGGLDILIGSLRARNVKPQMLALDLGAAQQAEVTINFGAGDLSRSISAQPSKPRLRSTSARAIWRSARPRPARSSTGRSKANCVTTSNPRAGCG